jgi:hypothetical protein
VCGWPANACTPAAAPVRAQQVILVRAPWNAVVHAQEVVDRGHNAVVIAHAPRAVVTACGQASATVLNASAGDTAAHVEGAAARAPSDGDHAGAAAARVVIAPATAATSVYRAKDARIEAASTASNARVETASAAPERPSQ